MGEGRTYICIDLKSFYASVECQERGLDPLTANLVVADESRTEKTICLAVSPSLKALGVPGRPRLFEVVQKVAAVNAARRYAAPGRRLTGESHDSVELAASPELAAGYITACPRMALYIQYSTKIYGIYLRFVAPEDIMVYSIDEVFIDATDYLRLYGLSARQLARRMIREVLAATGITATAGIGTNLYLAKVAMDIDAKHTTPDKDGVRIAELDEMSYRRRLWAHRPLTDFWRIGRGYAAKLEAAGLYTMGDIARCSLQNEDVLYKKFGVNAELLIDHAWGWEPCTMADIKAYRPSAGSMSTGQVLQCPYAVGKARLVVREMAESLAFELVEKSLVTDQLTLTVGYDRESLDDTRVAVRYQGELTTDYYGRSIPKHAHGTANLERQTSSSRLITDAVLALFDRIVNGDLLVRRVSLAACRITDAAAAAARRAPEQLGLFTDHEAEDRRRAEEEAALERERHMQQAALAIKKKYGKNALLKAADLEEGATAAQRNDQIGGHRA